MYKTPRKNEPILNFSGKVKRTWGFKLEELIARIKTRENRDVRRLIMHPTQLNLPALLAVTTASLGSSLLSSVCGVICLQLFINLISHPEDFKGVHMPALPHHKLLQIQNTLQKQVTNQAPQETIGTVEQYYSSFILIVSYA